MSDSLGQIHLKISADEKGVIKSFNNVDKKAKSLTKKLDKFGRIDSFIAQRAGALGLSLGFASITKNLIKTTVAFEQYNMSFNTLLGSAKEGAALMDDLTKFAAVTPFNLEGLAQYSKQLLATGIEAKNVVSTMSMLGDLAMGNNEVLGRMAYNYSQIKSDQRAYTRDLREFATAGIPIWEALAKTLGVSSQEIRGLAEDGKISFDIVEKSLKSLTSEGGRFYNSMANQSKTLGGMWSNLNDNISVLYKNIGNNLNPVLKDTVTILSNATQGWNDWLAAAKVEDRAKALLKVKQNELAIIETRKEYNKLLELSKDKDNYITDGFGQVLKKLSWRRKEFVGNITEAKRALSNLPMENLRLNLKYGFDKKKLKEDVDNAATPKNKKLSLSETKSTIEKKQVELDYKIASNNFSEEEKIQETIKFLNVRTNLLKSFPLEYKKSLIEELNTQKQFNELKLENVEEALNKEVKALELKQAYELAANNYTQVETYQQLIKHITAKQELYRSDLTKFTELEIEKLETKKSLSQLIVDNEKKVQDERQRVIESANQQMINTYRSGLDTLLSDYTNTAQKVMAVIAMMGTAGKALSAIKAGGGGMASLFNSKNISSILSFAGGFGGFRANGGDVQAGKSYVVGEDGPEVLKVGSSGSIIPNKAIAGGGGSNHVKATNVVINIQATDLASFESKLNQVKKTVSNIIRESIYNDSGMRSAIKNI